MSLILNKLIFSLLNFQVNYLIETLIMPEVINRSLAILPILPKFSEIPDFR